MSHVNMFLFTNGVVSHAAEAPLVTTLLENHAGAYTTTRTHKNGLEILFWERHLQRLSNSFNLLLKSNPKFLFDNFETNKVPILELSSRPTMWDPVIQLLVHDSMKKVVPFVSKELKIGEEYAITTLLSGNSEKLCCLEGNFDEKRVSEILDVYVHIGGYVPAALGVRVNEAHLAVVGRGRNLANAKYSEWVRLRKTLEKLRPPCVTELLLSNDDDHILEGCLTNFFVVRQKDIAWNYGTLVDPKNPIIVNCNFCGKTTNGGIYRHKLHLIGENRNVKACPKCPEHVKEEIRVFMQKKNKLKNQIEENEDDPIPRTKMHVKRPMSGGLNNSPTIQGKNLKQA